METGREIGRHSQKIKVLSHGPPPPNTYEGVFWGKSTTSKNVFREAFKKKPIFFVTNVTLALTPPPKCDEKPSAFFWSKMAFSASENFLLQPCYNLSISTVNF